jgi:hypothetical protein
MLERASILRVGLVVRLQVLDIPRRIAWNRRHVETEEEVELGGCGELRRRLEAIGYAVALPVFATNIEHKAIAEGSLEVARREDECNSHQI